jgi:hypothetical protein
LTQLEARLQPALASLDDMLELAGSLAPAPEHSRNALLVLHLRSLILRLDQLHMAELGLLFDRLNAFLHGHPQELGEAPVVETTLPMVLESGDAEGTRALLAAMAERSGHPSLSERPLQLAAAFMQQGHLAQVPRLARESAALAAEAGQHDVVRAAVAMERRCEAAQAAQALPPDGSPAVSPAVLAMAMAQARAIEAEDAGAVESVSGQILSSFS